MTPTTADKVKEILKLFLNFWYEPKELRIDNDSIDAFLATKEGSRSVGELGEKWVSVEDRLPELMEYVIIHNTEGGIFIGRRFSHDWVARFSDGEKPMKELAATHWQPLPKSPL